ncbi:Uncharacterised protein [Staphylococcus gallinarum]|uniref:Uncharacterized protein n=1 Tax=Staphylococcus gallinarum TaxID=1293 RepID=A0A380FCP6_STAGA|nr:Uncharacterised protein [Staphylococcus gallinarum]
MVNFIIEVIAYNEIEQIEAHDDSIQFVFNVGPMPIKELQKGDIQTFVDYVKSQMPS